MPVEPTKTQLRLGAINHCKMATNNTMSSKLLWFYSTECALKCLYLKKNNLPFFTKKLAGKFNHNLVRLSKECMIPSIDFKLSEIDDVDFPIKEFHEYMRYGVPLPPNTDIRQLKYIKDLNKIIKKQL